MATWDPVQYLKFAGHRLRPALDLLARVSVEVPGRVYDLGCGTGSATRMLADRWPGARVVGVDGSETMLTKARADHPGLTFRLGDLAAWKPEAPAHVLYSNAALHWLDGHDALFPRLAEALAPGGALAVQMPRNHDAPSHTGMVETARSGPWAAKLERHLRPAPVAAPEVYYDLLRPRVAELDIWETVYVQALEGDDPVVEWTRGTALKPLLDALDGPERAAFLDDYAARMRAAYPRRPDGRTLFPFRRLFIVARR